MKRILAVAVLSLAAVGPALAQPPQQQKIPISISYDGNDAVGTRFVFAIKENIRRSATYELVDSGRSIKLQMVSVDVNSADQGITSAIATAITAHYMGDDGKWGDAYVNTMIDVVGKERVEDMAHNFLATIDNYLTTLRTSSEVNQ